MVAPVAGVRSCQGVRPNSEQPTIKRLLEQAARCFRSVTNAAIGRSTLRDSARWSSILLRLSQFVVRTDIEQLRPRGPRSIRRRATTH